MTIFKSSSKAFAAYEKLNRNIDDVARFLGPLEDTQARIKTALADAESEYRKNPSAKTAESWEITYRRAHGPCGQNQVSPISSLLFGMREEIKHNQAAMRMSPEALNIYRSCLREKIDALDATITNKRNALSLALGAEDASGDIDGLSPLPTWRGRREYLQKLHDRLSVKIARRDVIDDPSDEARAAIEADHLNAPAPTPVKPRQQQAWPPGTTLEQAGLPQEAPTPPPPSLAVPISLTPLQPTIHQESYLRALERQQADEREYHVRKMSEKETV